VDSTAQKTQIPKAKKENSTSGLQLKYYNITEEGNFEGLNIPNLINSTIPKKLFDHREKRVHPHKDDKILTAWNGLMIAALAIGGRVLGIEKYTLAAEKASEFIFSKLVRPDGRLLAR